MSEPQINYEQQGGYLVASRADLEALTKALTANWQYQNAPTSFSGAAPLMVESLEHSLKSTTFTMKNIVLWPQMPMGQAYNTVEQYTRIIRYGSNGSPYFNEGGSPAEEDSDYTREVQRVVYFGTRRRVTHPVMLVETQFGDAVAREINNGNMWLLKNMERELYKGNADFVSAATGLMTGGAGDMPQDSLALNGLEQQIRSGDTDSRAVAVELEGYSGIKSVVRDLAGQILSPEELEEGSVSILNNMGVPTTMHVEPKVLSDLTRTYFPKERVNPMGVPNGRAGFVLKTFDASGGTFEIRTNVFLNAKTTPPPFGQRRNVPAAPSGCTTASVAAPVSTFDGTEVFRYAVTAANEMGESAPERIAGTITPVATQSVRVRIPNTVGGKFFGVYRTTDGGAAGSEEFLGWIRRDPSGGNTDFFDVNVRTPGAGTGFLLYLDAEAMQFKQLAPLSKINLATVATSLEWIQVLYGCLLVYTPRKHYLLSNIGRQA